MIRPVAVPRLCLVALIGLAMTLAAWAHRGPTGPAAQDFAAFLAAGGTLADICDETGDHVGLPGGCEACRLVAAAMLPRPVHSAAVPVGGAWALAPVVVDVPVHAADRPRGYSVRAPPAA